MSRLRVIAKRTAVGLGIVYLAASGAAAQETPSPPQLFYAVGPAEVPEQASLPENAMMNQTRFVRVNFGQLRSGRLSLNLLDGITVQAVLDRRQSHPTGGDSWLGSLNGVEDGRIALSRHGTSLSGVVATPDRMFKIQPLGNGVHVVAEVGISEPWPESDPVPVFAEDAGAGEGSLPLAEGDGGTTMIDVMVAYTPNARDVMGGTAGILSLIELAVAETNQIYINSQVDASLRLVHAYETAYTNDAAGFSTALNRLSGSTDGYMDEVHGLRDLYGADMVSLIIDNAQYCGIAYLMGDLSAGFESSAFSVVEDSCATGYYSFAHELGHNMGSHHNPENAGGALYPYSYGHWLYYDTAGEYIHRTVMAYNCTDYCTRMPYFSNPAVSLSYNGETQPTGIAEYEDNARSLNNTRETVAAWRDAAPLDPPADPSALSAEALDHERISLEWYDHADNESGFSIERSLDGETFVEIATIGSSAGIGTVGFTDAGLDSDTVYDYQIRAFNGVGYSDYSFTTQARTDIAPTGVRILASGEQSVHGSVSGTYLNTHDADGIGQTISETHSGGKPRNRYTWLEHRWSFTLPAANSHLLTAVVTADVGEGESFSFDYSTNGSDWVALFLVADGSDIYSAVIPATVSGQVQVRLRDFERVSGKQSANWVAVDHLYVDSDSGDIDPPAVPTGLYVSDVSSSSIGLSWDAPADIVDSYIVERADGASWTNIDTVPGSAISYTDAGLSAETLYSYRLIASNSGGVSDPSDPVSETTSPAATLFLTATYVGNTRGRKIVDLGWGGLGGDDVDVWRNGSLVDTILDSGSWVDSLKKGGSYVYEVCDAGGGVCTPEALVSF
jgi:peptidyl-Asp metalloendopeptidase